MTARDAATSAWRMPAPLAALVTRLPQLPLSALAAAGLSAVAAGCRDSGTLALLDNKVLRIVVHDAGLTLTVRCRGGRFIPLQRAARPDAIIGATLADFVALARRREDADTLFFARRLTLEGDTEAGLILRNLLDRVELAPVLAWLEKRVPLARLVPRLRSRGP